MRVRAAGLSQACACRVRRRAKRVLRLASPGTGDAISATSRCGRPREIPAKRRQRTVASNRFRSQFELKKTGMTFNPDFYSALFCKRKRASPRRFELLSPP